MVGAGAGVSPAPGAGGAGGAGVGAAGVAGLGLAGAPGVARRPGHRPGRTGFFPVALPTLRSQSRTRCLPRRDRAAAHPGD
ncbi:hypothetical protein DDQ68_00490 [Hymenobacter nivis]|uniref:Uncharacterized protein n=1 Tax=Hymenobacter nivis TaxID=1850093 RepID=A0A2Z3GJU8_9BACT|nr:hypothetical protein DDQ68_00490 [Hymenobacter nivis]